MFNKAKKIIAVSMLLSLVVGSTALAAYPNMYGKNYTKTKSGDICSMTAEGNQESAKTKIKNTANSKRYYSVYVDRRHNNGKIIEKDSKENVVGSGNWLIALVSRYRSTADRQHHHKALSWNCSMKPSGAGYTNFLDDKFEYTVSQNK